MTTINNSATSQSPNAEADVYRVAYGRSVFRTTFASHEEASAYLDESEALDLLNGTRLHQDERRFVLRGVVPVEIRFRVNGEWITADLVVDQ